MNIRFYDFKDVEGRDWTVDKQQISSITDVTLSGSNTKTRLTLKELKSGANVRIDIPLSIADIRKAIFNAESKFTKQL